MNSFNHYAYGAVGDWMYEKLAGIKQNKNSAGFEDIVFKPITDKRVPHIKASFDSVRGIISSEITQTAQNTEYIFTVPNGAHARAELNGKFYELNAGINKISM